MQILEIDVLDGNGPINVAVRDYFESERLKKFCKDAARVFSENDNDSESIKIYINQLIEIYNSGYKAGHHDTVEGGYVDIWQCDMESYHEDNVRELLEEVVK